MGGYNNTGSRKLEGTARGATLITVVYKLLQLTATDTLLNF